MIHNDDIWLANIGDSRIILIKESQKTQNIDYNERKNCAETSTEERKESNLPISQIEQATNIENQRQNSIPIIKYVQITTDHVTNHPDELKRLIESGGSVLPCKHSMI